MDDARQLLDSLMGSCRNENLRDAEKKRGENFKERNICKLFLLGFCPHYEELFVSTKRDLGRCGKVHSEACRAEFESHPEKKRFQVEYDKELRQKLEDLVREADEWVARAKRNIQAANEDIQQTGPNEVAKAEITRLTEQAQSLFEEAERLAEGGNITESRYRLEQAEERRRKASEWEEKAKTLLTENVCEVCGSRMESGDPERARQRHADGKVHVGYERIRRVLAEVRARLGEESRERERGRAHKDRDRDRRRSRSRRRHGVTEAGAVDPLDPLAAALEGERGKGRAREPRDGRSRSRGRRRSSGKDRDHDRGRRRG